MPLYDYFQSILQRILDFISDVVRCDSCFIYVLREERLILSASKNPHSELLNRLGLNMGQGITGWVAEHRQTVAIARNAATDPRFRRFNNLPEDAFEAFLSVPIISRGRAIGVINLQHRQAGGNEDAGKESWRKCSGTSALVNSSSEPRVFSSAGCTATKRARISGCSV